MKNLIITTFLTFISYQSYAQGLFMVGAGTASSPSPNAAVWDFFNSNGEIWTDFINNENKLSLNNLLSDVEDLLKANPKQIFTILNEFGENAGGISFDTEDEAVNFLKDLKAFIKVNI